jgi:uncharacterized protein (DUF433 family)
MQNDWRQHITSDEKVLNGKPVIQNTRISVELILELLASGWTYEMILESYPILKIDDLTAVFNYLRECIQHELYYSIKISA